MREGRESEISTGKIALGIAVWAAVAMLAVFVVATVQNVILGQVIVLAAVFAAWAIGERVVHPDEVR